MRSQASSLCWFCSSRQDVTADGKRNMRNFGQWVLQQIPMVTAREMLDLILRYTMLIYNPVTWFVCTRRHRVSKS